MHAELSFPLCHQVGEGRSEQKGQSLRLGKFFKIGNSSVATLKKIGNSSVATFV